ncbi:MAG: hypothetical protein M9942_12395 [Microthrixaceae bacterium]|nr:hypothetical protein [Microthrixaceae bacterium]
MKPVPGTGSGRSGVTRWPRVPRSLVAVIAVCAALVLSLLPPAGSAASPGGEPEGVDAPGGPTPDTPLGTARRVLVFSVPTLTWADVRDHDTPNMDRLLDDAVVGDLSVRSVTRRTGATDGYATLNAGTRTEGTPQGSLAFVAGLEAGEGQPGGDPTEVPAGAYETVPPDEDLPEPEVPSPEVTDDSGDAVEAPVATEPGEDYRGSPAAEEFARRTGLLPPVGSVFNFGIVSMRQLNSGLRFDSEVGALGDALGGAGVRRAVIANGDHGAGDLDVDYRREASIGLMDSSGIVERGRVSRTLLVEDPLAPFGTRYDNEEVAQAFASLWQGRSAVLVEASDMVRYEDVAPLVLERQRLDFRRQAVERSDQLLGLLLEDVDLERDAVVLVAPYASGETTDLTVVAVRSPTVSGGLLSSGTTRRDGFVQTVDIAPSILSLFDLGVPSSMEGTVMQRVGGAASLDQRSGDLIEAARAAVFRDRTLGGASVVFVVAQVALWVLAVWTLMKPGARLRTFVEVASLGVLLFLPMTFMAGAFPFHRSGTASWWVFVLGSSAVLAVVIQASTRRYLVDPLLVTLGFLVAFLSVDVLAGGPLQFNTVFGYTPTVAGRFNGLGNPAFSMLSAAGIILSALVAHRVPGRAGRYAAVALLGWCVVLDGAPMLGADVGGALSLVPAAGVTAWMLLGWRIRLRTVVVGALVTIAVVVGFGLLDLTRPAAEQTHLGRLLADIGTNGAGAFETVVLRKLDANLSVLTSSVWTLMLPVVFAAVAFVMYWAPWRIRTISERIPEERAALAGLVVAMVLGFALNDSGISVPGMMLGVANASLVNLLLRVDGDHPSRGPAQPGAPHPGRTSSTEPSPTSGTAS